jgi:hypothetical protein
MAEREVSVEFVFDRSADRELAHAYRMLVPERRARTAQTRDGDDHSQASTTGVSRAELAAGGAEADHDRSAVGA